MEKLFGIVLHQVEKEECVSSMDPQSGGSN